MRFNTLQRIGSFACVWLTCAVAAWAQPGVVTDYYDYPPGSTAHIAGAGFAPNEMVQLQVINVTNPGDTGEEHAPWTVAADAGGNFTATWFVTFDELDMTLHLTATGQTSGLVAETTFTDGNASDGSGTMTVTPATLAAGTLNTLQFTFASDSGKDYLPGSLATLTIPADWSAPQTNSPATPGFISIAPFGAGSGSISNLSGTGPWTVSLVFTAPKNGNGFVLTYSNALAPAVIGTNTFAAATRNSTSSGGTLVALGGSGTSGSPVVTVSGSAATQLAFITAAQTFAVGTDSGVMTVQIQNAGGNPTNAATARTVTLSTTSNGGTFQDTAGNAINSLVIVAGQNATNFIYTDAKAGSPTLTAGSPSPSALVPATQVATVNKASSNISIASTAATNGFRSLVGFIAGLPAAATGMVVFKTNNIALSSATAISSGTAGPLTTTNLVRGTNIVTAEYAGDANFLGSTNSVAQIITNHLPVVLNMTVYRVPGVSLKIPISAFVTNWSDADGDALNISAINDSTNGVKPFTSSAWILYPGTSKLNDRFSYDVSDGFGGKAAAQVNVVATPFVTGQNGGSLTVGNGVVIVKFMGIPGFTYEIQWTTNFVSPNWVDISTNLANTSGAILVTNALNGAGAGYYRLKWQ